MLTKLVLPVDAALKWQAATASAAPLAWHLAEIHAGHGRKAHDATSKGRFLANSVHEAVDDVGDTDQNSHGYQETDVGQSHYEGAKSTLDPKRHGGYQKTFAGASKKPNRAGGIRNISQELQISQLRKKQVETANEVIGRLATEATQEIERLKASKGFTDPVTKKLVWQVITLFRDVLRDESEKRGKAGEAIDKSLRFVSGNQRTPSKLIEDIKNQYANTKQSLEALDKPYDLEIAKEHVSKLINFYYKILTTNSKAMNPMNLTIMLHHFATIAKSTSLENWVIEAHGDFVETLTSEVHRRIGLFDSQGYATVVWSFGKLGAHAKQINVENSTFEQMMEGLLAAAQQNLSKFSLNDSLNVVLGLAGLQLSAKASGGLLRGLTKDFYYKVHQLHPNDLLALLWALGKLEGAYTSDLVGKMCAAVEKNFSQFDIAALCAFLKGLSSVSHRGTISLVNRAQFLMQQKADDFDLKTASKVVWTLLPLSVYPGSVLMNVLGDLLSSDQENLNPSTVTSTLAAMTHMDVPQPGAVEAAKEYFKQNSSQFTVSDAVRFLWSLSLMGALDSDIFTAAKVSALKDITPNQLSFEDKRQLCQLLISWRILNGQSSHGLFSFDIEESCYEAWKASQRVRSTFGFVSEVMGVLKEMGFTCRSPLVLDKIPMTVTSAVKTGQPGEDDLKLIIEVGSRTHTYRNKSPLLKPQQRWRTKILETMGWTVIRIPVFTWNRSPGKESRISLLQQAIKGATPVAPGALHPGKEEFTDSESQLEHNLQSDDISVGGDEAQEDKEAALEGGSEDDEALPPESKNIEKELEDMGIDMMGSQDTREEIPNVNY